MRLDRVPREEEQPVVEYGGWRFQALKVKNKTIESVHVVKNPLVNGQESC